MDHERLLAHTADPDPTRRALARPREHSRAYVRVLRRDGTPLPLTTATVLAHLRGALTIGLYSVDQQGLTPVQAVQAQLATRQIASYLEASRAGGHLWVFWQRPLRPDLARKILRPSAGDLALFPAGDVPDEVGLGLVLRAPLGVHRYSGERYPFVDAQRQPVSSGLVRVQLDWLWTHVQRIDPTPHLATLTEQAARTGQVPALPRDDPATARPIAAFLQPHTIRDVVGAYVRLNRAGVGRCPWGERHQHGDAHPSFAVFERTQKWWCFTERVGGNAFDFLCRYYGLDAREMLKRLEL